MLKTILQNNIKHASRVNILSKLNTCIYHNPFHVGSFGDSTCFLHVSSSACLLSTFGKIICETCQSYHKYIKGIHSVLEDILQLPLDASVHVFV